MESISLSSVIVTLEGFKVYAKNVAINVSVMI